MSVNAVDQTTGNTTPLAGNTNNLVGNLSALTTNTKSDAVGAINEVNQTKQNATDNNLQTTDKTIVGGINELRSGLTTQRIYTKTVTKNENDDNFVSTGVDLSEYDVLSAYEATGGAGAVCALGRSGNTVFVYLFGSNGTPYKSAATIEVYYVHRYTGND